MKQHQFRNRLLLAATSALFAGSTLAAVSAEEAKQLGTTLTLIGAEKAGNKEGTIPAYTGEGIKAPSSFRLDGTIQGRPDPFANEKPLFSITAQNLRSTLTSSTAWWKCSRSIRISAWTFTPRTERRRYRNGSRTTPSKMLPLARASTTI